MGRVNTTCFLYRQRNSHIKARFIHLCVIISQESLQSTSYVHGKPEKKNSCLELFGGVWCNG